MWYTGKRIPTNLITGFLGTGKTTAIRDLINHRPVGERWSIFVNEYGMVSIDDLMLENTSPEIQVQELAGGCFCCTMAGMMDTVLMQFIRRTRPDRLLIEPSGAGHPARVIDTLRSPRFQSALDLRATICLVDPKDFENPRVTNSAGFHDQIQMSDVVAINWTDKRDPDQVARCRQWIDHFDPPKLLVSETQFGRFDPAWLDLSGSVIRSPVFPQAHSVSEKPHDSQQTTVSQTTVSQTVQLLPATASSSTLQPVRLENEGNGQWACGWIFSADLVFHREELFDFLSALRTVQRVKGFFRCEDDWWHINRTGQDVSLQTTAYRRDSRLEIISDTADIDWQKTEARILEFVKHDSSSSA